MARLRLRLRQHRRRRARGAWQALVAANARLHLRLWRPTTSRRAPPTWCGSCWTPTPRCASSPRARRPTPRAGGAVPAVRGGGRPRARPRLHRRDRRAGLFRPWPGPDRRCRAPPARSTRPALDARCWPSRTSPTASRPRALSLTNATEYGAVYSAERDRGPDRPGQGQGAGRAPGRRAAGQRRGRRLRPQGASKAWASTSWWWAGPRPACRRPKPSCSSTSARAPLRRAAEAGRPAAVQGPVLPRRGSACWRAAPGPRHARHANAMARKLAGLMPFPVRHPVEANAVFVEMDERRCSACAAGWFVYRFTDGTVRFMCSWATTAEAVDASARRCERVRRLSRPSSDDRPNGRCCDWLSDAGSASAWRRRPVDP